MRACGVSIECVKQECVSRGMSRGYVSQVGGMSNINTH